ncbi:MAG: di-heme oxidoredictase family protein, partial [Pseudomonadota bacterium]
ACHKPSLPAGGELISPFTDLLLHDMGPELAAEANELSQAAEWRTAPLWGLAMVRFYLHDGRATSLEEAILWHGGEAAQSVSAYGQLTASEREILHSWLHRL